MNADIATYLIPRDLHKLGYDENNYITGFIDFAVQGGTTVHAKAENEFYYLIDQPVNVTISSEFGVYDLSDKGINKQQHIHQGKITITNNDVNVISVQFIQVILKQK